MNYLPSEALMVFLIDRIKRAYGDKGEVTQTQYPENSLTVISYLH